MKRSIAVLVILAAATVLTNPSISAPPVGSAPTPPEQVKVRLLQVDALVLDKDGRTVPGLAQGDFQLQLGSRVVPVDTFDVTCPDGAAPEPGNITDPTKLPPPIAPGVKRRIIVAID